MRAREQLVGHLSFGIRIRFFFSLLMRGETILLTREIGGVLAAIWAISKIDSREVMKKFI